MQTLNALQHDSPTAGSDTALEGISQIPNTDVKPNDRKRDQAEDDPKPTKPLTHATQA
jgi:hypothetical protein